MVSDNGRQFTSDAPIWSQAPIKNKLGPHSYTCILAHNNREIKRRLEQIRDCGVERTDDTSTHDEQNIMKEKSETTSNTAGRELRPRVKW